MRITDKVLKILQLAGLTESQVKSALARLELEEKLPKIVRAIRRLGVQVTITVNGATWRAEVDGLEFVGVIDESAVAESPRQVGTKRASGDSARAILRDLQARGVEVSDAALQYAAAYITRSKRLQDAIAAHPDLLERAKRLGLLP
jgi:SOS response regulatory protein OraA/RecX